MSDLLSVISSLRSAGFGAEQIIAAVESILHAEEEKKAEKREQTRQRVARHRNNKIEEKQDSGNALHALHRVTCVTHPSSPDGSPPNPLSLTPPPPSKSIPKGIPKGSPLLPDWLPANDWKAYLEMRIKIRKPMTDRAKELAIRELDRLRARGHPPDKVLEQSVLNSWQGLFEIKHNGNEHETNRINHHRSDNRKTEASDKWRNAWADAANPDI